MEHHSRTLQRNLTVERNHLSLFESWPVELCVFFQKARLLYRRALRTQVLDGLFHFALLGVCIAKEFSLLPRRAGVDPGDTYTYKANLLSPHAAFGKELLGCRKELFRRREGEGEAFLGRCSGKIAKADLDKDGSPCLSVLEESESYFVGEFEECVPYYLRVGHISFEGGFIGDGVAFSLIL